MPVCSRPSKHALALDTIQCYMRHDVFYHIRIALLKTFESHHEKKTQHFVFTTWIVQFLLLSPNSSASSHRLCLYSLVCFPEVCYRPGRISHYFLMTRRFYNHLKPLRSTTNSYQYQAPRLENFFMLNSAEHKIYHAHSCWHFNIY